MEKDGKRTDLVTRKNSFYIAVRVCAVAECDDTPMTGGGSSSLGPAIVEQGGEPAQGKQGDHNVDDPAPPKSVGGLSAWSANKDMQSRLKQLGAPIYGDTDALWKRLRE